MSETTGPISINVISIDFLRLEGCFKLIISTSIGTIYRSPKCLCSHMNFVLPHKNQIIFCLYIYYTLYGSVIEYGNKINKIKTGTYID